MEGDNITTEGTETRFDPAANREAIYFLETAEREKEVVNSFEILLMAAAHRDVHETRILNAWKVIKQETDRIQRKYGYANAMDDLRAAGDTYNFEGRRRGFSNDI
jgi:hypothetical protein